MKLVKRWAYRYKRRSRVVPTVLRRIDPNRSTAEYLHKAYLDHRRAKLAHLMSDTPRGPDQRQYSRYRGAAGLSAWFVEDVLAASIRLVAVNGRFVRRETSKPRWRQWLEMVTLAVWLPSMPENYYRFEWYLPEFRALARDYLHRHEVKKVLYKMLGDETGAPSVTDKAAFFQHGRRSGLPVVPMVAVVRRGQLRVEDGIDVDDVRYDLFAKRVAGKGGRGADRLTYVPGAVPAFRSANSGKERSLRGWLERYAKRSATASNTDGFLLQQRVTSHRDLRELAGQAAATCRVVTIIDERGEPEPVGAVFRMPGSLDGVVDNFHAGGLAAPVSLADGRLGEASRLGMAGDLERVTVRRETGAPIAGATLPMWPEVRDLAIRAHRAFAPRVLVGWDVCVTDDGPVLVEANAQPCTDFMQRVQRRPLGGTRYAELMAYHVRRYLADRT